MKKLKLILTSLSLIVFSSFVFAMEKNPKEIASSNEIKTTEAAEIKLKNNSDEKIEEQIPDITNYFKLTNPEKDNIESIITKNYQIKEDEIKEEKKEGEIKEEEKEDEIKKDKKKAFKEKVMDPLYKKIEDTMKEYLENEFKNSSYEYGEMKTTKKDLDFNNKTENKLYMIIKTRKNTNWDKTENINFCIEIKPDNIEIKPNNIKTNDKNKNKQENSDNIIKRKYFKKDKTQTKDEVFYDEKSEKSKFKNFNFDDDEKEDVKNAIFRNYNFKNKPLAKQEEIKNLALKRIESDVNYVLSDYIQFYEADGKTREIILKIPFKQIDKYGYENIENINLTIKFNIIKTKIETKKEEELKKITCNITLNVPNNKEIENPKNNKKTNNSTIEIKEREFFIKEKSETVSDPTRELNLMSLNYFSQSKFM